MAKKIILFSVALLLSLTFIIMALHGSAIVTAGAGSGAVESVTNVGELTEVLSAIDNYGTTAPEDRPSATVLLSENFKIKESRHSDENILVTDYDYYRLHKRELEIYYGEGAIYYRSKGIFTEEYDYVDKLTDDTHSMLEFNVDAYIGADGCYVRINKLIETAQTSTKMIRGAYEGEWVAVVPEIIEHLVNTDIISLSPLVDSINMLDMLIDDELIDENDTAAKLDEDSCPEIFKFLYPEDEYSFDFDCSIDFSDEDATRLYTYMRVKEGGFWSNLSRTRAESSLIIKDVGRTDVKINTGRISLEALDMDDFNDMFIIKERSEEAND